MTKVLLQPGEFICGERALAKEWKVSPSKARRILLLFKNEALIEVQPTNKFSLVKVVKWNEYQTFEAQSETPVKHKRNTNETPVKTYKNDKNEENDKNEKNSSNEGKKYGNQEINEMLEFLKLTIGVEDFTQSQKDQRFIGNNLVRLMKKITPDIFRARAEAILADDFKRKNCNSLSYLYGQIKGFVDPKAGYQKPKIGYG